MLKLRRAFRHLKRVPKWILKIAVNLIQDALKNGQIEIRFNNDDPLDQSMYFIVNKKW